MHLLARMCVPREGRTRNSRQYHGSYSRPACRDSARRGFIFLRRGSSYAILRSKAGFSFAIASNRNAELCGLREPCSQLRIVPMLVQRNSANSGWLSLRRFRTRRICAGLILAGGKAKRETRSFVLCPARYFFASTSPDIISSNKFAFMVSPSAPEWLLPASFSARPSSHLAHPC